MTLLRSTILARQGELVLVRTDEDDVLLHHPADVALAKWLTGVRDTEVTLAVTGETT